MMAKLEAVFATFGSAESVVLTPPTEVKIGDKVWIMHSGLYRYFTTTPTGDGPYEVMEIDHCLDPSIGSASARARPWVEPVNAVADISRQLGCDEEEAALIAEMTGWPSWRTAENPDAIDIYADWLEENGRAAEARTMHDMAFGYRVSGEEFTSRLAIRRCNAAHKAYWRFADAWLRRDDEG